MKIHWCRLEEGYGFFVRLICLSWCFTPVIMLSTYMLSAIWWAMGEAALVRWCLIIAANRNGLDIIPNGTLVNLSTWTFFLRVDLEGSFKQRNLVTSLSSGCKPTWRNSFSTSASSTTLWSLNLKRNPHRSSNMTGPRWRLWSRLWFFLPVFAEASNTILSFVVVFSGVSTSWCGM